MQREPGRCRGTSDVEIGKHLNNRSASIQVEAYDTGRVAQGNQNVVGLTTMPAEIIQKAGCVTGNWQQRNSILTVTQVYEKPTVEYARQRQLQPMSNTWLVEIQSSNRAS